MSSSGKTLQPELHQWYINFSWPLVINSSAVLITDDNDADESKHLKFFTCNRCQTILENGPHPSKQINEGLCPLSTKDGYCGVKVHYKHSHAQPHTHTNMKEHACCCGALSFLECLSGSINKDECGGVQGLIQDISQPTGLPVWPTGLPV